MPATPYVPGKKVGTFIISYAGSKTQSVDVFTNPAAGTTGYWLDIASKRKTLLGGTVSFTITNGLANVTSGKPPPVTTGPVTTGPVTTGPVTTGPVYTGTITKYVPTTPYVPGKKVGTFTISYAGSKTQSVDVFANPAAGTTGYWLDIASKRKTLLGGTVSFTITNGLANVTSGKPPPVTTGPVTLGPDTTGPVTLGPDTPSNQPMDTATGMPTFTSVPGTNVNISLGNANTNTIDGGGDGGGEGGYWGGGGVIGGVYPVMDYATEAPTDAPATSAPVATTDPPTSTSTAGGLSILDATPAPQDSGTFFCMSKRTLYIVLCIILCACLMGGIGYYILHKRAAGAAAGTGANATGGAGGGVGGDFGDLGQYGGGGV